MALIGFICDYSSTSGPKYPLNWLPVILWGGWRGRTRFLKALSLSHYSVPAQPLPSHCLTEFVNKMHWFHYFSCSEPSAKRWSNNTPCWACLVVLWSCLLCSNRITLSRIQSWEFELLLCQSSGSLYVRVRVKALALVPQRSSFMQGRNEDNVIKICCRLQMPALGHSVSLAVPYGFDCKTYGFRSAKHAKKSFITNNMKANMC